MSEKTWDPTQPHWSIMTKSHGGTVSIVRDLTLEQARQTYERLDPWHGEVIYIDRENERRTKEWNDSHKGSGTVMMGSSSSGRSRSVSNGDIDIREVFGPPGWTMADLGAQYWPRMATPEEQAVDDERQERMRPMREAQERRRQEELNKPHDYRAASGKMFSWLAPSRRGP